MLVWAHSLPCQILTTKLGFYLCSILHQLYHVFLWSLPSDMNYYRKSCLPLSCLLPHAECSCAMYLYFWHFPKGTWRLRNVNLIGWLGLWHFHQASEGSMMFISYAESLCTIKRQQLSKLSLHREKDGLMKCDEQEHTNTHTSMPSTSTSEIIWKFL